METKQLTDIVADSFINGWVPTDVSDEYMEALELCAWGTSACEEMRQVAARWQQSLNNLPVAQAVAISQLTSLRQALEQAYAQAQAVASPEHPATANLLLALREGLKALINSCNALIIAVEHRNWATLHTGLHCADKANSVLQVVYDSTHFV